MNISIKYITIIDNKLYVRVGRYIDATLPISAIELYRFDVTETKKLHYYYLKG